MKGCDPVDKTPGSLGSSVSSVSAGQAAASTLLPLESGELSRGDLSRWEDADTSGPCCEDTQEKQSTRAPAPAPFVPFSGGGQRLGGPPGPTRPLTSSSVTLPKSLSSPGVPSKPKKSKSGQDPQQEQEQEQEREPEPPVDLEPVDREPVDLEPVDREPVVCHPDLEERLQAWPAELPDEFFELTVDDVRRRLAQLKSERKRLEEAPLVTKAFREAQIKEKLERYPKVALRVLFPDRYVLQGFFRPSETVGDLRDFVRSHLGNPELSFYLFITPPKTVLDDHTRTLFQLINIGFGRCLGMEEDQCPGLQPTLPLGGPLRALGCCCPVPGDTWLPRQPPSPAVRQLGSSLGASRGGVPGDVPACLPSELAGLREGSLPPWQDSPVPYCCVAHCQGLSGSDRPLPPTHQALPHLDPLKRSSLTNGLAEGGLQVGLARPPVPTAASGQCPLGFCEQLQPGCESWRPRGDGACRPPANLFPAALVHFGAKEPAGVYLEPGLLEHAISLSAADMLVARCMSRVAGSPSPSPAPDPACESEPTAEAGALGPPEPIPGTAQPVKRSLGKVPKWLKLPASKR
ncbi:tether containing UBX domain for GLUT4 isoform X2 [Piliocolobus tephrosceles]|uniref:tether containing UBX domain for GLUT4 isoform X2 n=1 Tax=Piliocolobus tephrosceles TaxID=591936 RepID=UPI000E6B14AA|nr:tether containing UBX domain for GLUT4 isoform X2 [Piliocolobus tephrosceles]